MKAVLILRSILINIMIYSANQYSVSRIYRKYFGVKIGHNVRFTGKKISFGSDPSVSGTANNNWLLGTIISLSPPVSPLTIL